jgi:hypothetical protein
LHGWAFANQPTTASYTPSQSHNSLGGSVTVKRTSRGIYEAQFKKLGYSGTPLQVGNPQIVAVGTDPVHCKATTAMSDGAATDPSILLGVACHDAAGALADSKFVVMYASVDSTPAGEGAYGWFGPSCTPGGILNWNSTGSYINCTRTATGAYTIAAGQLGLTGVGANIQITAQGSSSSSDRCRVSSWGPDGSEFKMYVRCHEDSGAAVAADEGFYFNYSRAHATSLNGTGAYAYANNATSSSYTPGATFSNTSGVLAGKFQGTGRYWMSFPNLGIGNSRVPFVVAVGSTNAGGNYCKVEQWFSGTKPNGSNYLEVQTRCFDGNHQPVNTVYMVHVPSHTII